MFKYNLHGSKNTTDREYEQYYEKEQSRETKLTNEQAQRNAEKKGYPIIRQDNAPVSLQRVPDNRIVPGFDKKTMMVIVNDIKSDTGKGVLYVPSGRIRISKSVNQGREVSGYNDVIISVDGKNLVPYYIEQDGKMIKEECSLKEFMARQRNTESIDDFLADRLKKIDENQKEENEGGLAYGRNR